MRNPRRKSRIGVKDVPKMPRRRSKAKHVHPKQKSTKNEVEVVINGHIVNAFSNTVTDISVMSKSTAQALGFEMKDENPAVWFKSNSFQKLLHSNNHARRPGGQCMHIRGWPGGGNAFQWKSQQRIGHHRFQAIAHTSDSS